MVKVQTTHLSGVLIIEPTAYEDSRGFFFESFNEQRFAEATDIQTQFVQDNHLLSHKNVLRGLHYQIQDPQGKLSRVIKGEVFDVAVDLRKHSTTFGQWLGTILSADNRRQLWIPPGFAHGFVVLSDSAEFLYKTTTYWQPKYDRSIIWNDKDINIDWPINELPILSEKDQQATALTHAEVYP